MGYSIHVEETDGALRVSSTDSTGHRTTPSPTLTKHQREILLEVLENTKVYDRAPRTVVTPVAYVCLAHDGKVGIFEGQNMPPRAADTQDLILRVTHGTIEVIKNRWGYRGNLIALLRSTKGE